MFEIEILVKFGQLSFPQKKKGAGKATNWVKFGSMVSTLPETNIANENPIFPGKYHQNGGFSMGYVSLQDCNPG